MTYGFIKYQLMGIAAMYKQCMTKFQDTFVSVSYKNWLNE